MASRTIRNISFLAMCLAFVSLSVEVARAASSLGTTCSSWNMEDDVSCTFDSWGTWTASGTYDFSEMDEQDALNRAADLCDALWWAAEYDCYPSNDFEDYLEGEYSYPGECFITWPNFSCDQAMTGSFSVSCNVINWCAS